MIKIETEPAEKINKNTSKIFQSKLKNMDL